ncbi:MAG: sigma 54-interacting transcriptional regulator [Planctomycetota bacterium]|nr:sigma 54-interacting transcriptional regulator [Planctomycetota bacterium]
MGFIPAEDLVFVRAVGELSNVNPFIPERLDLEKVALGDAFVAEPHAFWGFTAEQITQRRSNLGLILDRARRVAEPLRNKLLRGPAVGDTQLSLYDDLVLYILFYEQLDAWGKSQPGSFVQSGTELATWKRYSTQFEYWLKLPGLQLPSVEQRVHLFEIFHQIYRAFFNIFHCVIGQSTQASRLRGRIWQSIFTHDLRRYRRSLYRTLHQVTTLITGPSGSGKDLVAEAIGMSRYIPFDPKQGTFAVAPSECYFGVNIAAMSRSLVESELFGHAKGAFTGAAGARVGWLEACGEHGTILLDEIGELDPTIQVKLLRVLQNRQFQRLGETRTRSFDGKIIAATNRDLQREIEAGTFREDLYYRLCSDVIETPSLASQVRDNPEVLENIVAYIAGRVAAGEQESLTREVIHWLRHKLPENYHWPGNIRELEQCVRNILIHGSYEPAQSRSSSSAGGQSPEVNRLAALLQSLSLTADELLSEYCRIAYQQTKSFEKAARLLQLDRRTVRAKVDRAATAEP